MIYKINKKDNNFISICSDCSSTSLPQTKGKALEFLTLVAKGDFEHQAELDDAKKAANLITQKCIKKAGWKNQINTLIMVFLKKLNIETDLSRIKRLNQEIQLKACQNTLDVKKRRELARENVRTYIEHCNEGNYDLQMDGIPCFVKIENNELICLSAKLTGNFIESTTTAIFMIVSAATNLNNPNRFNDFYQFPFALILFNNPPNIKPQPLSEDVKIVFTDLFMILSNLKKIKNVKEIQKLTQYIPQWQDVEEEIGDLLIRLIT